MAKKLPKALREYFARIGKKGGAKGGHATAAKLSPDQRREAARKAVLARWAKAKTKRKRSE